MASTSIYTFDNLSLSQPKKEQKDSQFTANSLLQLIANPAEVLSESDERISEYIRASLAANTRQAYRSDLAHFAKWGGSIPTTSEQLLRYLGDHAGHLAIATLARRLASLSRAHVSRGFTNPVKSEIVRATLKGIRRIHGSEQKAVAPISKPELLAMLEGLSGIKGRRDKALLLIGFAGAFRRSELVALAVEDISFGEQGVTVNIRHSKTDQAGIGRKIGIPYARGAVCPVYSLKAWLENAHISHGPIFRSITKHGCISGPALSPQAVAVIIKSRVSAIGLDPTKYSGHSLRAGLVTSAAQAGVSNWKIKQQTGHRSDAMLGRYMRDSSLFVDNAAGAIL